MAKYAALPWDCILGAELAQAYKPDPKTYLTGVELLGLQPEQVMMVAAHQGDLLAAGALGLRTVFVPRPMEFGPNRTPDPTPDPSFDLVAEDFRDLASQLEC
jgi:2-haloacid dehalogenase